MRCCVCWSGVHVRLTVCSVSMTLHGPFDLNNPATTHTSTHTPPHTSTPHTPTTPPSSGKTLRFCYDRLSSLLKTLEISNTEDYTPIHLVADFATLVGTYSRG